MASTSSAMTTLAMDRASYQAADDEIPDELFDNLAPHADAVAIRAPLPPAAANIDAAAALLETLPSLPSLKGYEERLGGIQSALDEARVEAAAIREELRQKADMLRKLAAAIESV